MKYVWNYIKNRFRRCFPISLADLYPVMDEGQRRYREEFGNIVDQYLIYYDSDWDEERIPAEKSHIIVYIDAQNDVEWILEGPKYQLTPEQMAVIATLDVAQMMPIQNLSHKEVLNFKKLLGVGYCAALLGNLNEVSSAIKEAELYRNDRNKERSRYLLLTSATVFLILAIVTYLLFIHLLPHHVHFNWLTGILMGMVGSYVSIWTRYGKMDMTGLGLKRLHYLESFSRFLIGGIFAMVLILAMEVGVVFPQMVDMSTKLWVYCFVGFIAGFSEQLVPSVLEKFGGEVDNKKDKEQKE